DPMVAANPAAIRHALHFMVGTSSFNLPPVLNDLNDPVQPYLKLSTAPLYSSANSGRAWAREVRKKVKSGGRLPECPRGRTIGFSAGPRAQARSGGQGGPVKHPSRYLGRQSAPRAAHQCDEADAPAKGIRLDRLRCYDTLAMERCRISTLGSRRRCRRRSPRHPFVPTG